MAMELTYAHVRRGHIIRSQVKPVFMFMPLIPPFPIVLAHLPVPT